MQVACPSCAADYPVNERRLPASGLKMRCPKCGARFHVHPDGRTDAVEATSAKLGKPPASPAVPPAPPKAAMPRPHPPAESGAHELSELDLPAPKSKAPPPPRSPFAAPPKPAHAPKAAVAKVAPPGAAEELDLDLPAPRAAVAKPPPKAAVEPNLDLPAPKGAVAKAAVKSAAVVEPGLDLPAPKGAVAKAAVKSAAAAELDLDLPAAKPVPAPKAPLPSAAAKKVPPPLGAAAPRPPAPPREPDLDLDLDLPAPKKQPFATELDLDLPAPGSSAPAPIDLELDLPAPRSAAKGKAAAGSAGELDLDLPAPKAPASRLGSPPGSASRKDPAPPFDLDLDLPGPRGAAAAPPRTVDEFQHEPPTVLAKKKPAAPPVAPPELDFPVPSAAVRSPNASPGAKKPIAPPMDPELDLPVPSAAVRSPNASPGAKKPIAPPVAPPKPALANDERTPFDDLDLPPPPSASARPPPKSVLAEADEAFGDLDLPMPKVAVDPGGFGELDLPIPTSGADLPVPAGTLELPTPVPRSGDGGFGDLDLPLPKAEGAGPLDLPRLRSDPPAHDGGFGDLDLPEPRDITELPQSSGAADRPVVHGAEHLPAPTDGDFGELDLPEPRSSWGSSSPASDAREPRPGAGGTSFGELDFGESPDDMEFADIPQRSADSVVDPLPAPHVAVTKEPAADVPVRSPKRRSRAAILAGTFVALVLAAGAALGLTPYGYFGVYFFDRFMPGAGDPAQVRAVIERAEEQARLDTWSDVREALRTLARARRSAGLNRELLARSLVHESLYQIRFGADPSSATRASAIRSRLEERGALGPELALALAADAVRTGNVNDARARLAIARTHAPRDPYVDLVEGELALVEREFARAREAFARAVEHGGGARALWGVARASHEDTEAFGEAIEAVLRESPEHEDAIVAKAERLVDGDAAAALALAERIVAPRADGERRRVSPRARAGAWTVIGRVSELRGRSTQALAAYDRALAAHDAHVPALLGAGRVLLENRPADAIARFDSVLQAGRGSDVVLASGRTAAQEARLGSARAHLALDRVQDAATTLEQLAAERTNDTEVLLWLGHAERRLDPPEREAAEQHYRAAIASAPDRFPAYFALAELFLESDRDADAGIVLEQAAARVPESAEMRLALGNFELRRNRLPAAVRELSRAIELDPELPAAHFALGVAFRRSGRLDEADRTFEHLAQIDPGHPRLALERGLLFEARGEPARAVEAYEAALRENEGDMDLMLRLGAAQVAAGRIDDAERTLQAVRQARPTSPEVAHFVGRIAFARGRYGEALTQFRQAVRIDPTRGELHLYVAWAALESNLLGEARESAEAAITRDPSLGEAYWIRAVVRLRSGDPASALPDLVRALELRPSFHRAHATMGDALDQLGRLNEAIASYERAVAHVDDEGEWWWRLGRLRMDRGDRRGAAQALSRATLLGEADAPLPGWLAAAHRLYGEALRAENRDEAVAHYRRYLELAPPGDIDRAEVRRILMNMGEIPPE